MLPFDDNVIKVISDAYEAGFNIPVKYFEKDYNKVPEDAEAYCNNPLYIIKPQGTEFTYIMYWTGKKMKGGFISINNNYSGVQRGAWSRNGETLFAGHIYELKRCCKRLIDLEKPQWICESFVMDETGKIFYWGKDSIEYYSEPLSKLTGHTIVELEEIYTNQKSKKPEGFVASLLVIKDGAPLYVYTAEPDESISKAWKGLYASLCMTNKAYSYSNGVDVYMRTGFAKLNIHRKLS